MRRWLVLILLLQLFLRTHESLALPGYADESHHIRRAEVAWDLTEDPLASYQPGKLLLYYYLGVFETERHNYLLVSRLAVALLTLIGAAAVYAIGKKVFDERVGVMAAFVYAVSPFMLFFDRMALADPMATALLLVAVWYALIWFQQPTRRHAIILGLLLILPPLAKLTAVGIIVAPATLVLLFDRRNWRQYAPQIGIMAAISAVFWIPLFLPTFIGEIQGGEDRVVLVGDYLLNAHEEDQGFVENLVDSTITAFEQTGTFISPLVLILLLPLTVLLLRQQPRMTLFLLAMFIAAWFPAIALGSFPRSRYLELGVPFLFLLAVGGLYRFAAQFDFELARRQTIERAVVVGILLYGLVWGGHFFLQAIDDPRQLDVPPDDRWRYMQAVTAGYGQIESIAFLKADGSTSAESEQVEVFGALGSCHLLRLFFEDPGIIHLTCIPFEADRQLSDETLRTLSDDATLHSGVYVLLERELLFDRPIPTNMGELPVAWEFVRLFPRPHDGVAVELWRITADDGGDYAFPDLP